jgi:hypothetical protein
MYLISLYLAPQLLSAADERASNDTLREAHVWWSYVWHELKRQGPMGAGTGTGSGVGVGVSDLVGNFGAVSLFESDSQAQLVSNKLKENLRTSAVLLATTRQVRHSLPRS